MDDHGPQEFPDSAAARLRRGRLTVPEHVAVRAFPEETIVLNLQTGTYHATNASGGVFLQVLREHAVFDAAVAELVRQFPDADAGRIERDLQDFCVALAEDGLLEVADG
jgi:hypothetical protein